MGLGTSKPAHSKLQSAIGLDIGHYSIKCVELANSQDKLKLQRVSIFPIDRASSDSVGKTLKLIFDQHATAARRVRISVSGGASLLTRRIQLPSMTHSELKGAIRFEAESHIPFPIDDCLLDFQILNQSDDKKTMNVILVAAKKDFIQDKLKMLAAAGLTPEVIDVDIFCLINAYEMLGPEPTENTFGLLNIGHVSSSFAIIQDRRPFFVRELPFGAQEVNKALAEMKGISEAEADKLKIERAPETLADVKAAAEKGFAPLSEGMTHSIDYFENETGEELKSIWLSGGGALCAGTPEVLSAELGKQVILWDNTKKMEIFGDIDQQFLAEHSSELNVALGMVLRGTGHKK